MIFNNERYISLTECSKTFNIDVNILKYWVKKQFISATYIGKICYIRTALLDQISTLSNAGMSEEAIKQVFIDFMNSINGNMMPDRIPYQRLISSKALSTLSHTTGKTPEEIISGLKYAYSQSWNYCVDVPVLKIYLAHSLAVNRALQLENHLLKEKLETFSYCGNINGPVTPQVVSSNIKSQLWRQLSAPIAELPLSVRIINSVHKGGLVTIFDFIVAEKACGMNGLLCKLSHFGKQSFREIESYLKNKKLISILPTGEWVSPAHKFIEETNFIFIKYKSNHLVDIGLQEERKINSPSKSISTSTIVRKTKALQEELL